MAHLLHSFIALFFCSFAPSFPPFRSPPPPSPPLQERNKPIEPPKQPEAAPFFLPSTKTLDPKFLAREDDDEEGAGAASGSRIVNWGQDQERSRLAKLIKKLPDVAANSDEADCIVGATMKYLKSLSPSAIDVELQSLCNADDDEEGLALLGAAALFFRHMLAARQDFELVGAYMNRFLHVHTDSILASPSTLACVTELRDLQAKEWNRVRGLMENSLCLVQYFSRIQQ